MSRVYYTDLRTHNGINLLEKLEKLITKAGIENIDFEKKYVAIKIHFGEPGNLAYLRPNYSKVVVDKVKKLNGKPFLTDCNTLYVGRRNNGLVHLEAAYENGYNPFQTGAHVIIADGIKGTDEALIKIDEEYVKEAKVGRALADADIIISMNHFKGHEGAGFGGALKNIGMGGGSRAGKMEMHSSGKPIIEKEKCKSCAACMRICNWDAPFFDKNKKAQIDYDKCVGCGRCIGVCPFDAIHAPWDESNDILNKKIAEYTKAILKDKPNFHINFIMDVSPNCDCHSENDASIVPNIGILASFDPVSLDMACVDLVNKAPKLSMSMLNDVEEATNDKFNNLHPDTNWEVGIDHAVKIGLGEKEYELIKI